jgi:DNA polymerase-3 subunit alpha
VLDDRSGRIEVTLFEDVYQQYRALIARDAILVVEGSLRFDDFVDDWRIAAKRIIDIAQAREQYARRLVLRWPRGTNGDGSALIGAIEQVLRPARGGRCAVAIRYAAEAASANVLLGEEWSVRPSQELIERLGQLVGRDGVELVYAPRVEG